MLSAAIILSGCQTLQTPTNTQAESKPVQADTVEQPRVTKTKPVVTKQLIANKDIWQITRDNFKLDLYQDNPRFRAQLKWYTRHPQYMNRVVKRASRYYFHILNQVIDRGMPAELALLPVVESAYDPFAYSHGRASGPWQFIPGTGKQYGLKQTWWYDGRRDIVASTTAALNYLDKLQKRYNGDWQLALAAYNAGEGNVDKAVRRNKAAGKPIDFWSLKLPKETSAYVPKLLAVARLFDKPGSFGYTPDIIPNKPFFTQVSTGGQIDLTQAATLADISMEELYLLNPGFNRWATDPHGPHYLLVPVDKADNFSKRIAELPLNKRMSWDRHIVKSGDTLSQIASKFSTSTAVIKSSNKLRSSRISIGQALMIPKARKGQQAYVLSQSQRNERNQQKIAKTTKKHKVTYKVKSGDSLWTIARAHKVNVRRLASWNAMATRDTLSIGQKLIVWKNPATTTAQQTAPTSPAAISRTIGYKVRNGDSLYVIASRFNVSVDDIKRWNHLNKRYLQPGQKLKLYVDIRK